MIGCDQHGVAVVVDGWIAAHSGTVFGVMKWFWIDSDGVMMFGE